MLGSKRCEGIRHRLNLISYIEYKQLFKTTELCRPRLRVDTKSKYIIILRSDWSFGSYIEQNRVTIAQVGYFRKRHIVLIITFLRHTKPQIICLKKVQTMIRPVAISGDSNSIAYGRFTDLTLHTGCVFLEKI